MLKIVKFGNSGTHPRILELQNSGVRPGITELQSCDERLEFRHPGRDGDGVRRVGRISSEGAVVRSRRCKRRKLLCFNVR